MSKWRVYYDDGSVFSAEDGAPKDAPPFGVQVIAMPDETVGRLLVSGFDCYVWRDGEWYGCDMFGLVDALAHWPGCPVKFGRTVSQAKFREVHEAARSDDYLPRKSATDRRRERV